MPSNFIGEQQQQKGQKNPKNGWWQILKIGKTSKNAWGNDKVEFNNFLMNSYLTNKKWIKA